ncbi:hypothetical protein DFJ58DRAFT_716386 [Suillus subalutaceus]|uniref:uncharacterized protein n=1 Tax=Suillus subalutaceus TaxID=48586 RepID=UPI001B8633C8|nr:uncharacterized protein DFJ58DRAFT_716386 [Suillus subalutaceus]KAG1854169.1 hypothetical protein DFJ58DRAFT_716386 [Suillus subalutaceus]
MAKLHLKRTPAEETERALRKARKAAKAARKRSHLSEEAGEHGESSSKRRRRVEVIDSDLDEEVYGPPPPPSLSSAHKSDYDSILSELEEARFKEKMWDALRDDERLDGIDARFNDYAHVPDRWRANTARGGSPEDQTDMDPRFMDDDTYAEWIRAGMWRRKHARQYEEEARMKAEKAARSARKKEMKAETARLEKAVEERRKQKKRERESQREENARAEYDRKWKVLLDPNTQHASSLSFGDIPWPLFVPMTQSDTAHSDASSITLEHFTATAISAFLIPISTTSALAQEVGVSLPIHDRDKKEKKEKLREAMLRFHPDKFEGRVMRKIIETDKDRVREAVGQVVRVLNTLMEE